MSLEDRTSQFVSRANITHDGKYIYSNVCYTGSGSKVSIICRDHGEFAQRPNDHLRGNGCPTCKFAKIASLKRKTAHHFICDAIEIHGDCYDYDAVDYVNAKTKVEITCKIHGAFWQTPDKHLGAETGCPKCSNHVSKGERVIQNFLDSRKIGYVREKRFDDLLGSTANSRLRFDFWIPIFNMLIEYDGEHHFMPVRTKGRISQEQAISNHQSTIINDQKKNEYAFLHGYRLERIHFSENLQDRLLHIFDGHS